jgi:hypothetical protein
MLRLLPNVLYSKTSERRSFLKNLFLFVLSVHLVFFGSMILMSIIGKKQDKFTISMHQTGATYVLMPLQKKVDSNGMYAGKGNSGSSHKSQVLAYDEYLERKKNGKKVSQKNISSKQKVGKTKQEIPKTKKIKSKATAILADKKYVDKKNKHKKLLRAKNKKQKKNKIKIVEQIQNEPLDSSKQEAAIVQQEQVSNQVSSEIVQDVHDEQSSSDTTLSAVSDNVIFVGYEQFDECVIGSKIQHAIIQSWTPPVGLDQGVSCEMKITVSPDGAAESIVVAKTSGVLVFDMSARTALQQIEFPQEVHGKTISIVLGN